MKRLGMACAIVSMVGAMQAAAQAAPVQIDFNVPGFGPPSGTVSTFTKNDVYGSLDLTFEAYNNPSLTVPALLYWDADDGLGHADGFGVIGVGYTSDEIEEDERLAIRFSQAVHLYGFNLTDLFFEQEPNLENCSIGMPNCYFETGSFLLEFGNGTNSGWLGFSAFVTSVRSTNGEFNLDFDFANVIGILFRAPGETLAAFPAPYQKLEDFSVAGIKLDIDPVAAPEPASLMLLGLGLSGIAAVRRRRLRG